MSSFLGDLRFALRGLARTPRVPAAVVLTLTLGIGATAAVFSVVDAVLLERLPYPQPEQLFMVDTTYHSPTGIEPQPTSWLDFRDWHERQRSFQGLAAFSNPRSFHLRVEGEVQRLTGELLPAASLSVPGLRPLVGRAFTAAETLPPGRRVVLLGHDLWRKRFGGDPAVVGRV